MSTEQETILKDGRIYLHKEEYHKFKDKFFEVEIQKNNKSLSFIKYLNKERRFFIPRDIRKKLNLEPKDIITINIKEIKNIKREKEIIKNNKFNSLAFIPEKTLSGYPILVLEKKNKLLCWYLNYGGSKEVIINKNMPSKFAKCLGYYQAEGGKPKLAKRRAREFSFVNTSLKIIKDFIGLLKYLIDIKIIKTTIYYNKKLSKDRIEKVKEKLIKYGIREENLYINKAKRIRNYSIKLWISSSILTDIFINMVDKTRNYLSENCDKESEKLTKLFLRGLFNGDGNFACAKDKHGSLHSFLRFFERERQYIEDYKRLLEKLELNGKIRKEGNKNLYILNIYLNWDKLLKLIETDLIKDSKKQHQKLIWNLKNHRWYKSQKHFKNLNPIFCGNHIRELMPKKICYNWVKKRINEGTVQKIRRGIYELTDKGLYTKNILEKI